MPVTFAPGRLRLATRPISTGSAALLKMIGIVPAPSLPQGRADSSLQSHLLSDEPDLPLMPVLGRTDPPPTDIRKSHSDLRRSSLRQANGERCTNGVLKRFGIHC